MKILVTGGAGYLGTTLVPLLLAGGHSVTVLDSLRFGIGPLVPLFRHPHFSFARVDIRDRNAIGEHARRADAIVHLAAIVGYPACAETPDDAQSTNVDGTRNIAEAAGRGRTVVLASTSSCYGEVADAICTEDTPLRPVSLYGHTKVEAESIVLGQCDAVVLRLATVYGISPRLRLDTMVNDFTYRAVRDRRLMVYESGHRRSFIHVSDVARAILLAMEKPQEMAGRVFNVGDERQNCTKLDVCSVIQSIVHGVEVGNEPTGHDVDRRDYAIGYGRIRALGFQASIPLDHGIREIANVAPWIERQELYCNLASPACGRAAGGEEALR